MRFIVEACGSFSYPLAALSLLSIALVIGYLVAFLRGAELGEKASAGVFMKRVSSMSMGVGLLGSMVGMVAAFTVSEGRLEPATIAKAMSFAYVTTGWGVSNSLLVQGGEILIDRLRGRAAKVSS